jgi:hypothetical protein
LTELKFCGFLSEPNDLNYLKKMLGRAWVEEIARLEIGEFVLQSRRTIQRVKVEIEDRNAPKPLKYGWNYQIAHALGVGLKAK